MKCKGYIMERQGLVSWAVFGPSHCGTQNHLHGGYIPIRWRIRLYCENSLDANGFLIDNMALLHFMEYTASQATDLSCELLMDKTAQTLQAYIERTEPTLRLRGIRITFSPEPFEAAMTQLYGESL